MRLSQRVGLIIWIVLGFLLLIDFIYYWVSYQRFSPLGTFLLVIYGLSSIAIPLLGIPLFTIKGMTHRALMMLALLVTLISFLSYLVFNR